MDTDEETTEEQDVLVSDGDWIAEQVDLIALEDGFDG